METRVRIDRARVNHEQPAPAHLMVSITAPEVADANRKPIDVVIVLDVSQSMDERVASGPESVTKIVLAKRAVRKFIEQLAVDDRVGIVTFSTATEVVATPKPIDETRRVVLIARVAKLRTIASTDLVSGAIAGLALLGGCPADGARTRRVILFTDGLPSSGITRHAEVLRAIGARLDRKTPITTFGFGENIVPNGQSGGGYDPELLMAIARQSGGNFYHTEGPEGILEAFASELGFLRSVAATDVRVRITPGKAAIREVLNDYTVRTEHGITTIEVGNLYGGETQHIVVAVEFPKVEKAFPRDMLAATVAVTGVETSGAAYATTEQVHIRYVKPNEAKEEKPDTDVTDQCARLIVAKAIEEAVEKAEAGDFVGARAVLRSAATAFDEPTRFTADLEAKLGAIGDDIKDARGFARHSGQVRAAAAAYGSGRSTGTRYVQCDTGAQAKAKADMGVGAPAAQANVAPQPAPAAPAPVPSPDKKRRRVW